MKLKGILYMLPVLLALVAAGCADHKEPVAGIDGQGAPLNITVGFEMMSTRLQELGSPQDMNDEHFGLSNVGLYVYYTSDYSASTPDLSKPYIRNMKCEIDGNNRLVPVVEDWQGDEDKHIFIYDDMTIVAFYPYNEEMSLEQNWFKTKADEEKYPITRNDYSQQYYIPYKATVRTNPTISYYTELWFYPKHTYKVEIVVVSDDVADFVGADDVVILPNIDPIDTQDTDLDGKRVKWYDIANESMNNRTGGSNVRQYISYIWTKETGDNDIPRGEVLLKAGNLTLIASQDVPVQEQRVYRYGYNMSTGEIFIPTSTNLIWDAESLAAFKGGNSNGYQVCDIDLDGVTWNPSSITQGRFDGGGHKVSNLNISGAEGNVGLFSVLTYDATVCNVNLIDPVINVTSADTVNVGAVVGKVSDVIPDNILDDIIASLPPGLSEVVKQAIIADLLSKMQGSTCKVAACRVENPVIVVNAPAPRVGTICGTAGERYDEDEYEAAIWSCYSLGGSITVNAGNEADNAGGYVGGFCGLNNGRIFGSYTTIENIIFQQLQADGTLVSDYTGFATVGDLLTDASVSDSYSVLPDANAAQMPGSWPSWTSNAQWWPILNTGWLDSETLYWYNAGSAPDNYPILQWERR